MDDLIITATDKTLGINFDAEKGVLEMRGMYYSDKARDFFQPIKAWVEDYIVRIEKPVILNLKILYLNSTSIKNLIDILEMLETFYEKGGSVKVCWYYEEEDDIQEMGREFAEDMGLPFELVCY